jgi:hypothetical protein
MNAAHLLADLRAQGFEVTPDGKALIVRPASRLSDTLKEAVRAAKNDLLACLWAEMLREHYEARAAILEHDGGLPRTEAEANARASTGLLARNLGLSWAALRLALNDLALPDSPDPVDRPPYGLPAWCLSPDRKPYKQGKHDHHQGVSAMSLNLAADKPTFELPPTGSISARCCHVIDLGTQTAEFQNERRHVRKVVVAWQLAGRRSDGTPFILSRRFTASLHEKAVLRGFIEAWRGHPLKPEELAGFNLRRLINAPCLLNIVHVEKGGNAFAEVRTIAPLPRGMTPPPDVADPIIFDIDDPDTWPAFDRLSKRLQAAIEASPEWKGRQARSGPFGGEDCEISF